ncbi:MAG: diacylglycerol kinase family lipid kinase [Firmicutes bacterium]|nr:diacylglycerol kinase family lipid kinase [Bacillota bacterium]
MINFIVNARSGGGKGQKTLKKIMNYCYKNHVEYTVHLTNSQGHATRIAKALCDNDSHLIAAVGGDGTFHEVLNGITDFEKTALGFIPSGRGNDFAHGVGIPLDPIKALKAIISGKEKRMDYLSMGGKRCLNVGGTGLDVNVLLKVAGSQNKLTYYRSLLHCIFHFEPFDVTVTAEDGAEKTYTCLMIGTANGSQFGGGIKLSPLSKADDGLMNVVIMSMPADGKILKVLPKFTKGKHLDLPVTTHFTAKSVKIKTDKPRPLQMDGEIYYDLIYNCKIVAGGIRTFEM